MVQKEKLHGSFKETALVVMGWLLFMGGEVFSPSLIQIGCKTIARVLP